MGRPLQTQLQRSVLTGSHLGHSRQDTKPTVETVQDRIRRGRCSLEQQGFWLSLLLARGPSLLHTPEPQSLSGPCLEQR